MQARHSSRLHQDNQDALVGKLQAATAYLETIQEKYQDKEAPLKLAEQLHAVIGLLDEIHREVVMQELTSVLQNETLPTATRKATVAKLFHLVVRQKG
jgi:hypothetical protein